MLEEVMQNFARTLHVLEVTSLLVGADRFKDELHRILLRTGIFDVHYQKVFDFLSMVCFRPVQNEVFAAIKLEETKRSPEDPVSAQEEALWVEFKGMLNGPMWANRILGIPARSPIFSRTRTLATPAKKTTVDEKTAGTNLELQATLGRGDIRKIEWAEAAAEKLLRAVTELLGGQLTEMPNLNRETLIRIFMTGKSDEAYEPIRLALETALDEERKRQSASGSRGLTFSGITTFMNNCFVNPATNLKRSRQLF